MVHSELQTYMRWACGYLFSAGGIHSPEIQAKIVKFLNSLLVQAGEFLFLILSLRQREWSDENSSFMWESVLILSPTLPEGPGASSLE